MDFMGADPQEWRRLLDHANAGELTLDPDVGNGLDKVCTDYLDHLDELLKTALTVREVDGFGPFPSGQALKEKFSQKGSGTPQSIDAILLEHIETVKLIRQVVAKSIANAQAVDESTGQAITNIGPDQ
uniref:hypothetical protein n=1 Tax=Nocardia donostiensis TaxID=1538463 RepID=UPI0009D9BF75|nr:hypothetical protein [Nocardia donostiensis]